MKRILKDQENDILTFETTREELEVCSKVTHLALDWLGDEFSARHQDTHEDPYETGLELGKTLEALLDEHKDVSPPDLITITIRFFEAGIIYDAFNEVCNGLSFGFANVPTLKELIGYNKEELKAFYDRYEKIYLN
ncbi:hypothetical protein [Entomobacter blattae]|uniref:Uncharacterized protein n=1 Tax=Entomobacter blattae TaxID=2762277 RepID=A0A7H1NRK8_9PROT|nr:hypothetical protein [Entomobacter blattae]QNT78414.1 hypothetical protein JGUZn3_11880 [Entomobacter blattae]QNT78418.1 hypothetical protein JGUZn3_11920 [Entomobacter blattae]